MRKTLMACVAIALLGSPAMAQIPWTTPMTNQQLSEQAEQITCEALNVALQQHDRPAMWGAARMANGDWLWMNYRGEYGSNQAKMLMTLCDQYPSRSIHDVLEVIAGVEDPPPPPKPRVRPVPQPFVQHNRDLPARGFVPSPPMMPTR